MFNVIAKIAAGAAVAAASNYAGRAIGEKLVRDNESEINRAKAKKAARHLANLLIDIDACGVETKPHEKTWDLHQDAKATGCIGLATAMVVQTTEDKPHIGFYQARLFGDQTTLVVDGEEVAIFNTPDFRGVIKKAIADHIFIVGYNMES